MVPNIKIGVIHSGKLIHELVVDELKDVTIGTALNNTITLETNNFYENFSFLVYNNGKYYLNVYRGAVGKIFEGKNILSLADIPNHPDAVQNGDVYTLSLSSDMRGIFIVGNETILFKIYASEPIPEKLPKEFSDRFFSSEFDFTFFSILAAFILTYIVLVVSFSHVKVVEHMRFEQIPERFARLIMNSPGPFKNGKHKKPEVKELAKKEEKVEPKEKPTVHDKKKNSKSKEKASGKVATITTVRPGGGNPSKNTSEIVRSSGIIGIIGSRGKGGSVANLFHGGDFNDKLNKALKGVSGLKAATSITEAKMKRGSGDAQGIEVGDLKSVTGSGLVAFGNSNASAVNIMGDIGEGDIEGEGRMSPSIIARILAQHVGAFQYCYNKALQGNPKLSGELKVRFTIQTDGLVDKKNIGYSGLTSRDNNLTSCVGRVFGRIRFPSPKGGDVIVNYPLNFMSQN
jgi:hypothetical protein